MGEHTYRRAVTELNARGWRSQEPGDDGNAEHPVMLGRALDVLRDQGLVSAISPPLPTVRVTLWN